MHNEWRNIPTSSVCPANVATSQGMIPWGIRILVEIPIDSDVVSHIHRKMNQVTLWDIK